MNEIKSFIDKIHESAATDEIVDTQNNLKETIHKELSVNEIYSKLISQSRKKLGLPK